MSKIYRVNPDTATTTEIPRVLCKNEDVELQQLLLNTHDLLPGDQINPESPRRWLLVNREMPVPSPSSGADTWSVDFLFGDQDATPTLVECKRYADTRSRREIVGQMLEYAANGHHYWNSTSLLKLAQEAQNKLNGTLSDALSRIAPQEFDTPETYFEEMERKLKSGEVRIVFFLDQSPMELRSIVEFLNRQTLHMEVLLVEVNNHVLDGTRIVSPRLFGYTEEARATKAIPQTTSDSLRRKWNEETFFEEVRRRLDQPSSDAIFDFYNHAKRLCFNAPWGTGSHNGSFNLKDSNTSSRSFLSIYSDGRIVFNAGYLDGEEKERNARDFLKTRLTDVGMAIDESKYPKVYPNWTKLDWPNKVQALKTLLDDFSTWSANYTSESPEHIQPPIPAYFNDPSA